MAYGFLLGLFLCSCFSEFLNILITEELTFLQYIKIGIYAVISGFMGVACSIYSISFLYLFATRSRRVDSAKSLNDSSMGEDNKNER